MTERVPHVGDWAWHKNGLDPRPVSQVSKEGTYVKLLIQSVETDWVPAQNYHFEESAISQ